MNRKINDRIYVLDTTLCDDHIAVTVIPATVRKIVTTQEAGEDGEPTETTVCMVAYDGEGPCASFHVASEDRIVTPERWESDISRRLGVAVVAAIEAQKVAPADPEPLPLPPPMEPRPVVVEEPF